MKATVFSKAVVMMAVEMCIRDRGEGDEKVYVDGETFPSHFGTGTEDYYGYAWGRYEPWINHPFVAQPLGDGCYAHIGLAPNTRVRSLDAIPFIWRLRFDMELFDWSNIHLNYAPITLSLIHILIITNVLRTGTCRKTRTCWN